MLGIADFLNISLFVWGLGHVTFVKASVQILPSPIWNLITLHLGIMTYFGLGTSN